MFKKLLGLSFLLIVAGAAIVTAQPVVIQSPVGEGLALVGEETDYRVESPSGETEQLEVPARASLSAFTELAGGWFAGGHRWTDRGRELVLLRKTSEGVELLDAPEQDSEGFRVLPIPLSYGGLLTGLAWLEGDGGEHNAVRWASWDGRLWGAPETVSPLSDRGQLALSGTVLADGTVLLVWAAEDGTDEEIVWSMRQESGWTTPARVHEDNSVPDVIPTVVATDAGALVAWSRNDGRSYRLRIARFDGGEWIETAFVGERGSYRPTAFAADRGVGFLYRVVAPATWTAIEMESDGRVRRRAAVEGSPAEARPLVFPGEASLVFPELGESGTSESLRSQARRVALEWVTEP